MKTTQAHHPTLRRGKHVATLSACYAVAPGTAIRATVARSAATASVPAGVAAASAFGYVVLPPSKRRALRRWTLNRRAVDHRTPRSGVRDFFLARVAAVDDKALAGLILWGSLESVPRVARRRLGR